MDFLKAFLIGTAMALIAGVLWRRWRKDQLAARQRLAMLCLEDERPGLSGKFVAAASKVGKPRGLKWEAVDLHDNVVFAADRVTNELYALIDATIRFSAIEGGGMEEVEAVGNLRSAAAVFVHRQGHWETDGRVVFNLNPEEAAEHYAESLEVIPYD